MEKVVVNQLLCKAGCGECVSECPENVFKMGPSQKAYVDDADACIGEGACGECLEVCTENAIILNEQK
jgi:NAD-dependent dihydropyrimidine dehydrogenase PreA subunit